MTTMKVESGSGAEAWTGRPVQWLAQADLVLWLAGWWRLAVQGQAAPEPIEPSQWVALLDAAEFGELTPEIREAMALLEVARSRTPWAEVVAEHHRLFEASIVCPANEAAFIRRDKGAILGDVAGFYRAFGFDLVPGRGERVDHLACELEFLGLLLTMLAQAQQQRWSDRRRVTRKAMRAFASDHLDAWLPRFGQRLQEMTVLPLYGHLAELLLLVWKALGQVHRLPPAVPEPLLGDGVLADQPPEIACPSQACTIEGVALDGR